MLVRAESMTRVTSNAQNRDFFRSFAPSALRLAKARDLTSGRAGAGVLKRVRVTENQAPPSAEILRRA